MKNLKTSFFVAVVFSMIMSSCTGQQTSSTNAYKDVTVEEATKMMKENNKLLVLDVRTPGEVAEGKIEGAMVIDFQGPNFNSMIDKLDKAQPVLVYCAVGGRSGKTMDMMKKKGFKEVYNLEGGIQAWNAAGKPLTDN